MASYAFVVEPKVSPRRRGSFTTGKRSTMAATCWTLATWNQFVGNTTSRFTVGGQANNRKIGTHFKPINGANSFRE